jgi:glycine cleavage system H protein
MASPTDLRYSESHEWHRVEGDQVTMGLTRFAVDELTDVTYIELPAVGTDVQPSASVGEVESVKTTSDIYIAVAGKVTEVNQAAIDDPSLLNSDPFGKGWLIRVQTSDVSPVDGLMDAAAYDAKYPTD